MSRSPASLAALGDILLSGRSPAWREVRRLVELSAPTAANVLILGGPGTGREYVAQAVHALSPRREAPYLTLPCGALSSSEWERALFGAGKLLAKAQQGTLFLDEVGAIGLEIQKQLTPAVLGDVRLVLAAEGPLGVVMREQRFGSELFRRLRLFPIPVPELAQYPEMLPELVRELVLFHSKKWKKNIDRIPPETLRAMAAWDWPGNLPELESFVQRAVKQSTGRTLMAPVGELAAPATAPVGRSTLEEVQREHILRVLRECGGVVKKAAAELGVPRTTLNARIKKLAIRRGEF